MRQRVRRVGPALVVLLAAACGSTAQHRTGPSTTAGLGLPAGSGSSSATAAPGSLGGAPGASGLPAPGGAGSAAPGAGVAPAAGAASNGGGSVSPGGTVPVGSRPVAGASAPGITPTTIYIGASHVGDVAAADAALGAAGLNPGNSQDEINVLIRYLNAHGGIAHRKIVPIWFEGSATQNVQSEYQQACAKWTQDNKVFAFGLGDLAAGTPLFDQCAASAHVFNITTGGVATEDLPTLRKFTNDILATELTNDHAMQATIDGLAAQGYFAKGARVGIATWDQSDFAYSVTHVALPMLSRLGYSHVPVQYISPPQSEGDLSTTSASISSAVLKFQTQRIDHVLLFDGTAGINGAGTLVLLWMNDAQTQHYNPRYGLNSASGLSTLAPELPAAQMAGSLAVGWIPVLDETQSDYPTSAYPAVAKDCLHIMAAGGEAPTTVNQTAGELGICDWLFFLKHVLDPLGASITTSRALAAIDAVGRGFTPASTFGLDVSSARHDGVSVVRNAAFVSSCTCYRYTGPPQRIG